MQRHPFIHSYLAGLFRAGLPQVGMLAGWLTACQPPPEPVVVAVYPSTLACTVDDKPIRCEETAIYLRDTLKTPANLRIYISAVSSDPVPKDNPLLDQIAAGVRKVGYTDVRTSNFDFK